MIKITLNGEIKQVEGQSVAEFIETQSSNASGLAIAINQRVISRSQWPQTQLSDNDNITLFQAVAGG